MTFILISEPSLSKGIEAPVDEQTEAIVDEPMALLLLRHEGVLYSNER